TAKSALPTPARRASPNALSSHARESSGKRASSQRSRTAVADIIRTAADDRCAQQKVSPPTPKIVAQPAPPQQLRTMKRLLDHRPRVAIFHSGAAWTAAVAVFGGWLAVGVGCTGKISAPGATGQA